MVTVNVSLTNDLSLFVDFEAKHKSYKSADECLQSLIVEERKRRAIQELEAKLLKGLERPMVEMDRAEWDSIREEARRGLSQEELSVKGTVRRSAEARHDLVARDNHCYQTHTHQSLPSSLISLP